MTRQDPLSLKTLVALVIANMIGAGVFTTSGFALADLGSPARVMSAWLVGGLIAICGALGYGALVRLLPASGGEYLYLSRTIHPLAGFLGGWISFLAGFTAAIAFSAMTFVAYAMPEASGATFGNAVASAVIIAAALLHGVRLEPGTVAQNLTVAVKLVLIVLFCGFAVIAGLLSGWPGLNELSVSPAPRTPFSLPAFALTLMWVSFSYSGFNAAVYIAGEVPEAATRVPRALWLGTVATLIIYLLLNAIFVLAPPYDAVAGQQDVAAVAARVVGGPWLETAVRGVIALALLTSVSAMVMIGPRVYAKMADDGLLPERLGFAGRIPSFAVWAQALCSIAVVWVAGIRELLSYLGFTLGISTALTVATLFLAVRREPVKARQLPGYPWAPLIYTISVLIFATLGGIRRPAEMLAAIATIVSGCVLYFLMSRHRAGSR